MVTTCAGKGPTVSLSITMVVARGTMFTSAHLSGDRDSLSADTTVSLSHYR